MNVLKTDPTRIEIEGKTLKCHVCDHEAFHKRKSHLETALASGLTSEWTDAQAYCLICDRCGHMEWFLSR